MTKTAIVTGAAGFIGGHLLERLLDAGVDAAGVDDMSNGHPELLPAHVASKIISCDCADEKVLHMIADSDGVDVVYHMAALPRVSFSVEHPLETHAVNYDKTLALLEAMRVSQKRPRLVFASSSSVYGGEATLPAREADVHPFAQASPYAMQKMQCEMAMKMYAKLYGVDCVALRFFNVFGPRQLGDSPYATAIAAWLTSIFEGKDLRSDGDGSQTRDMCYVGNVVDALVAAGDRERSFAGDAFNVGCGSRTSNASILEWLKRRFTANMSIVSAPWRPGDVMHTQADVSRAREELGYVPTVDIWRGLEMTADWYESHYTKEMI